MKAFEHIAVDRHPKLHSVARVALNRPQVSNAMSDQTLKELSGAFHVLSADKELRAVVVRGEGKHFCSGADIEWMKRAGSLKPADGRKDAKLLAEMGRAIQDCAVPVVAQVHGACYGGGLGVVAAADIAVAAEDARMCFSECRLGILPAVISLFVLPKIGEAQARRWYLTSEVFSMAQARDLGLVHEVVAPAELELRVEAILDHIVRNGPQAVRAAKALLGGFSSAKDKEKLVLDALLARRSSAEGQEGLSAFLEKRPANWLK
ncbi:MAG: enoyl-CoA hydratase/isomerase family protein [Elusimicrobia bacterium]|nr:enoyl-CoA hydratase/isomerase family protein [Elusimicrobiota bacterium]